MFRRIATAAAALALAAGVSPALGSTQSGHPPVDSSGAHYRVCSVPGPVGDDYNVMARSGTSCRLAYYVFTTLVGHYVNANGQGIPPSNSETLRLNVTNSAGTGPAFSYPVEYRVTVNLRSRRRYCTDRGCFRDTGEVYCTPAAGASTPYVHFTLYALVDAVAGNYQGP
jgi:hypothetical protein